MKVVLFVDHEIGYRLLEKALNLHASACINLLAIFTTKENGTQWWPGIEKLAKSSGLPFFRFSPEEQSELHNFVEADYFFLLSWRHIVNNEFLSIPQQGVINLHYSLLPKFRGVYPVNWAIIEGEKQTGVSFHWVISSIDKGNVIIQKSIPIMMHDTARSLQLKLDETALTLFDELLVCLEKKYYQKDCAEPLECPTAYYSKKKFIASNQVNLNEVTSVGDFINLLRGKTFYPEGRNAYFIDPITTKKVYISLVLQPEEQG